jgi:hypothetical protein
VDENKAVDPHEIEALLSASRELGPEYDRELARQLAERIRSWAPPAPAKPRKDQRLEIIASSLALSIPILAIAIWAAKADGFFAVLALDAVIILSVLWRGD